MWIAVWTALRMLVLFGVAGWSGYHAFQAIRTGTATTQGGRVRRRKQPIFFWFAVVAQTAFAVTFSGLAVGLLVREAAR